MEENDVNSRRRIQYSDNLEELISMAVADGKITDKEKKALLRRAMDEGIDPDEFEMVLESRLRDVSVEATDKGEVLDTEGRRSIMSSEKLAKLLLKEDSAKRRINIIKDFPIPSAAEDLLEFIMTMSSKAKNQGKASDNDGGDGFMEKRAYVAKYDEACLKAQTFFPGDSRFTNLMNSTALSRQDRRTKETFFQKYKGLIILEIVLGIFAYLLYPIKFKDDEAEGFVSVILGFAMIIVVLFRFLGDNEKKESKED